MWTKTTLRLHVIPEGVALIKESGNKEWWWGRVGITLSTAGGSETGTYTLEINVDIPKTVKLEIPLDPDIPLLAIFPKELKTYCTDTCIPMFITAPLTITVS